MKLAEASARKFNYRTWKIPIVVASVLIVGMLLTLLVFVPLVFGEQFVSFSPELVYAGPEYHPSMEIVYINGSVVQVAWIGLWVNVTNSYIVPVEVKYNGFEFVWLIYNQTVTDPMDVVGNKDYLVWGAFYAAYTIGGSGSGVYGFYGGPGYWPNITGYESGYDYYAAHKDRSNYTETIAVGTRRYPVFLESSALSLTVWGGQTISPPHQAVAPGTYYIYVIAYGKVSEPISLTVTSVLWSR